MSPSQLQLELHWTQDFWSPIHCISLIPRFILAWIQTVFPLSTFPLIDLNFLTFVPVMCVRHCSLLDRICELLTYLYQCLANSYICYFLCLYFFCFRFLICKILCSIDLLCILSPVCESLQILFAKDNAWNCIITLWRIIYIIQSGVSFCKWGNWG